MNTRPKRLGTLPAAIIGEISLVTISCDTYTDPGQEVNVRLPLNQTMFIAHANERADSGNFPTDKILVRRTRRALH